MKSYKTLLFIAASVALLTLVVCLFPADGVNVCGVNLRMPTLDKIMNPNDGRRNGSVGDMDAGQMASLKDSAEYYRNRMLNGSNRFWFPDGNIDYFNPLMARMQEAQSLGEVVRIVHYGDSQIEMDRMTSRLRSYAQKTFGGGGPGMIPLQTVISNPVVTLKTTGKLQYKAPYGNKKNSNSVNGQYGPLVHSHVIDANGEVRTTIKSSNAKSVDDAAKGFDRLRLIYGNREEAEGTLWCRVSPTEGMCKDSVQKGRSGNQPVATMKWDFSQPVKEATIEMKGNATLFGVMADKGAGVAVDNVPMRGCSGRQFGMINAQELECAYRNMNVGLIIMQFGGNAVPTISGERSLAAYAKSLGEQIDYLHRCCPDALILFVGPGDMCKSVRGEKVTYPMLPAIVEGVRDTVTSHGAAFWSLFDAMGGSGTMAEWVPQHLAGKDYIHFTQRGADLMGDRLAEALDNAYRYFLLRKQMEPKPLMAENKSAKK